MFGLLCATPEELQALKSVLAIRSAPTAFGPTQVWTGAHNGRPVAMAQAGIGKVNAAAAATLLLAVFKARTLIFSGVAGGLNPALGVGTVVLGARVAIHDYGVMIEGRLAPTASGRIPIGAPPLEDLPLAAPQVLEDLEALRASVGPQIAQPVVLGSLITADYFLNCPVTRDALHAAFAADAIDMESGAVHQVAEAWAVPLYVIRTLSDRAGEDSHVTYGDMAARTAANSALCVPALMAVIERRAGG